MEIYSNDFDELNFKYLPYYIHMICSKDFNEFKARLSHFDKELINPERYVNIDDNKGIFENEYYKLNYNDRSSEFSNKNSITEVYNLDLEKMKLKCSDNYILILENSLNNEHKLKNEKILDMDRILKNRLLEIEKKDNQISELKKNERKLEIQNKNLLEENEKLKNTLAYKIKSFLKI